MKLVEKLDDLPWMAETIELVRQSLAERHPLDEGLRAALLEEQQQLNEAIVGWKQSLGNPKLLAEQRSALESEWARAVERLAEIDSDLQQFEGRARQAEVIVDPEKVLTRVNRLADILAEDNPTRANVELSLFIDRIICHPDGKVDVRICKLGTSPEACELLAQDDDTCEPDRAKSSVKGIPRRRCKPRNTSGDHDSDWEAISYFATDPNRFAGLPEHFFWLDTLQVPDKLTPWSVEHAEEVFKRRQSEKLSYDQLTKIFPKSKPTMKRAVKYYLETHPGAVDEVELSAGGRRGRRIDVGPIADEVRQLWWNEYWSKLELARKYECSTTTIDRALKVSYEKTSEIVPTETARGKHMAKTARQILASGADLASIAKVLRSSDVTVRKLLREAFEVDGEVMPDLRKRRAKSD